MRRSEIACLLFIFSSTLHTFGQTAGTGVPLFSVPMNFAPDQINPSNLNIHLSVPIYSKPATGVNVAMSFDSGPGPSRPIANFTGPGGGPFTTDYTGIANFAPLPSSPATIASMYLEDEYTGGQSSFQDSSGSIICSDGKAIHYQILSYVETNGTAHQFPPENFSDSTCPNYYASGLKAIDGSGYTLVFTGPKTNGMVYGKNGLQITLGAGLKNTATDTNGNTTSAEPTDFTNNIINYTDMTGQTVLSYGPVCPGSGVCTPTNPVPFTYTGPTGSVAVNIYHSVHTETSSFKCTQEYNQTYRLIDKIVYPDGSSYQFAYLTDGRISKITLPTGGWIQYSYPGSNNGINCNNFFTQAVTRTDSNGVVWKFVRNYPGNTTSNYTVTVTDPSGNDTVYAFTLNSTGTTYGNPIPTVSFPTQVVVYSGSSTASSPVILQTTTTCYNQAAMPCANPAYDSVHTPITQRDTYVQLGTKTNKTTEIYDSTYGNLTDVYSYDWYNGTSYPLVSHVNYGGMGQSWNGSACVNIGGFINDRPCFVHTFDGSGNYVANTNFTYDSKGNTKVISRWASGAISGSGSNATCPSSGSYLNQCYTYNANGTVATATDVNGAVTTYAYNGTGGCDNLLATSITNALAFGSSMTWDCNGGVVKTLMDANQNQTTYNYDPSWRVSSATGPFGTVTGTYTANTRQSTFNFNNGSSTQDTATTLDPMGRDVLTQTLQSPGSSSFDTQSRAYDLNGRLATVSMPCVAAAGAGCSTAGLSITYDALNRPTQASNPGTGGYVSYSYVNNDVLITVGPAPNGENTKQKQYEYDGVGRLTSVCELTSSSGSGSCAQTTSRTGYWAKYGYDALGRLTGVTQNAQGSPAQARSFTYDPTGRLTSESNPESGLTKYVYDTIPAPGICGGYTGIAGDLLQINKADGTFNCYFHDGLHRLTDVGGNQAGHYCKRFRYDNASNGIGGQPSGSTLTNIAGRLVNAETDNCALPISSTTDEWFSYDADGHQTDVYESTPNSGGYYHTSVGYSANGVPLSLSGIPNYGTMTYGLDGEGRWSSAQHNTQAIVCDSSCSSASTLYNAAGQTTQINIGGTGNNGSGDNDTYTYYSTTGRMHTYAFTVGSAPTTDSGTLTWNPNGSLQTLAITDGFNSGGTQTCNYYYDDLGRLGGKDTNGFSVDCGSAWQQLFTFDAFGNITKSGSLQWLPGYNQSTNQYTTPTNCQTSGGTPCYDADGNLLSDGSHTYSWDAHGKLATIDSSACGSNGTCLTYDALGRVVEENVSGTFTQILYSPVGKTAIMSGQTTTNSYIPLPGGAMEFEGSTTGGSHTFFHQDWLGSARFGTRVVDRSVLFDRAFAPFGEVYAKVTGGNVNTDFTGDTQDIIAGTYDTPNRELNPNQGRWISADPGGMSAADPTNPQSWNRYAYVANNPLAMTDQSGLGPPPCWRTSTCYYDLGASFGGPTPVPLGQPLLYPGSMGMTSCITDGADLGCGYAMSLLQSGNPSLFSQNAFFFNANQAMNTAPATETVLFPNEVATYYDENGNVEDRQFIGGYYATFTIGDRGGNGWDWCGSGCGSALKWMSDFSAGAGDFLSFGLTTRVNKLTGAQSVVNTNSGAYGAGIATGIGVTAAGGALAAGKAFAGLETKIAIHDADHMFALIGKVPHLQINWWLPGVAASGQAIRMPLTPWWP